MFGYQNQFNAPAVQDNPEMQMFNPSAMSVGPLAGQAAVNFQVEIMALYIQETGTFDDQFQGSYIATAPDQFANNILDAALSAPGGVGGRGLAGIGSSLVDIDTANSRLAVIPNGWGERRFRFMLMTREKSKTFGGQTFYTYLQGFTDRKDISLQSGILAPDTAFFINSFVRIAETNVMQPDGSASMQHRIHSQGQLLNGVLTASQNPGGITKFTRPVDVYRNIQVLSDSALMARDVTDLRNQNLNNGYGTNSVLNNYENNTASGFVSRLLTPALRATNQMSHGVGNGNFYTNAAGNAGSMEPTVETFPILTLLQRSTQRPGSPMFTLNELASIDPSVGQRTYVRTIEASYQGSVANRGRGANWNDALPETLLAKKLLSSIPGVLWRNYVGTASFTFTNSIGAGRVETRVEHIKSFTVATPPDAIAAFYDELEEVIARDVSYNHQLMFTVNVNVSVLDDIMLNVSVNGSPARLYIAPCFSSGILNPMYTQDAQGFKHLSNGIYSFTESLLTMKRADSDHISGQLDDIV